MSISTIIFDLGNVVLTNDWHINNPAKNRDFSEYFHVTKDDLERAWNAHWPAYKRGRMTEEAFWEEFLKEADAHTIDVRHAKKLYRKYLITFI